MTNKSKVVLSAVVAGAVSLATAVQALPSITGDIEFGGGAATTDTGNLATATKFISITGVTVTATAETGSYAALNGGGASAAFTAINFTTFTAGTLWTVMSGGVTYSFEATSVTSVGPSPRSSSFLNITGMGIASITGFADTPGNWTITDTTSDPNDVEVTFSASTTATAPESSTTVVLLGLGLTGLALFAKGRKQLEA